MAFNVLFAIIAYYDLDINQMDIKIAFLYGLINQLIYMQIFKGSESSSTKGIACKLLNVFYDLKQASRL